MSRRRLGLLKARKIDADPIEPRKVVVTNDTITAVRRSLFHLVPISTTVALLVLNLRGIFIGYDLSGAIKSETINLMLLQLAAKAHEILIVSSLGLIVLHAVRHELLFGDGLPLGLIGSGLTFNNFNLLFKKEFYGSLRYLTTHGNRSKKAAFVLLLLVAILVAALAGPSSAVLLVPRLQTWPSAMTEVFLNATDNELWPGDLRGNLTELSSLCQAQNATDLAICPAAGYASLREHWSRMNSSTFLSQDIPPYARLLSGSMFYWPIRSPKSLLPPLYILGDSRQSSRPGDKTTLVQPQAAAVAVFEQAATDWWKAMTGQKAKGREGMDALINDRQVRAHGKSAIGTVRCAPAELLSNSTKTVSFPTIPFWFDYGETAEFEIADLNAVPSEALQYQWVRLPGSFGPASIGGVFQSPWQADNSSRVVLGCTAQLGWVPTDVRTDSYSFWSGWYPWNITYGDRRPHYTAAAHDDSLSPTNGRIALGQTWLNLLTPQLQDEEQLSTIESILSSAGLGERGNDPEISALDVWGEDDLATESRSAQLEAVICSVLVDGLSRTSSRHAFSIDGPASQWHLASYSPRSDFSQRILSGQNAFDPPETAGGITTLHTKMSITGFALRASLATFLAMSVLLVHAILAIGHMALVLFDRRTSRSWDSVSELLVLAQNSMPSFKLLANTGAGIEQKTTFAHLARIRVRNGADDSDSSRVELLFEQDAENSFQQTSRPSHGKRNESSVGEHDDWPSLLAQDTDSVRSEHGPRASWTWPQDPRARAAQLQDTEMHSRSTSVERLIPRAHLVDGRNAHLSKVTVNNAYG